MIIEKNNCNIPEYLDGTFFKKALVSRIKCDDVEIKGLHFTMGSSGGENYLSLIYRVRISYKLPNLPQGDETFIVKSIPLGGAKEIFADMNIYEKEKEMYFNIMPKIEDILKSIKITPRCYYTVDNPIATIVFEDMKASGYEVADRIEGLNEEHCKVLLTKLGRYHAGGMMLLKQEPSIRENYLLKHGIISSVSFSPILWGKYWDDGISRLANHASKWLGYEKIVGKLRKIHQNAIFVERIKDSMRISKNDILTVCHGDTWVNNLLFQYEFNEESPTDVVLIDFQGSIVGSIGLDVNYFLHSSLQVDVFASKRKDLIRNSYCNALRTTLQKGGFENIPTVQDIENEIERKAVYGFMATIIVLPFVSMKKEDSGDSSFETLSEESSANRLKDSACSSPRFLETMKILLKEYDQCGMLDF